MSDKSQIVKLAFGPKSPRTLGKSGQNLWSRITGGYNISDAGGIELLCLACEATDRIADIRAVIDREGPVIRTRNGPRDHPLLRYEIQNRALVSKLLQRLGLDMEASPVPPPPGPGRPPGPGPGVSFEDLER